MRVRGSHSSSPNCFCTSLDEVVTRLLAPTPDTMFGSGAGEIGLLRLDDNVPMFRPMSSGLLT